MLVVQEMKKVIGSMTSHANTYLSHTHTHTHDYRRPEGCKTGSFRLVNVCVWITR